MHNRKTTLFFPETGGRQKSQNGSDSIDPDALTKALKDFEEAGRRRERTPGTSPSRKRQRVYGDRYVVFLSRGAGYEIGTDTCGWVDSFLIVKDKICKRHTVCCTKTVALRRLRNRRSAHHIQNFTSKRVSLIVEIPFTPLGSEQTLTFTVAEEANRMYSRVLRSELFGNTVPQADLDSLSSDPFSGLSNGINDKTRAHTPPSHAVSNLPPASITPSTPHKNLFTYAAPRVGSGQHTPSKTPRSHHGPNLNVRSELYSLSPIRYDSQRILETPRKQPRYVNKVPYKVLDAPDLQDDFYLNLVDWGSSNVLGVGLGNSVYMWNSHSGRVTKLCELKDDTVTSVSWIQRVSLYSTDPLRPLLIDHKIETNHVCLL